MLIPRRKKSSKNKVYNPNPPQLDLDYLDLPEYEPTSGQPDPSVDTSELTSDQWTPEELEQLPAFESTEAVNAVGPSQKTYPPVNPADMTAFSVPTEGEPAATPTQQRMWENEQHLLDIERYWTNRSPDEGARKEGETAEEYWRRFMSDHYRQVTGGRIHDAYLEASYLAAAPREDAKLFGRILMDIENNAPEIYDMEIDEAAEAAFDYLYYGLSDPFNIAPIVVSGIATGGVGAPVAAAATVATTKQAAIQVMRKALLMRGLKGVAGSMLIGGALSAAQEHGVQRVEKEAGVDPNTRQFTNKPASEIPTNIQRNLTAGALGMAFDAIPGLANSLYFSPKAQINRIMQAKRLDSNIAGRNIKERIAASLETDPVEGKVPDEVLMTAMRMADDTEKVTKRAPPIFDPTNPDPELSGAFNIIDYVDPKTKDKALINIAAPEIQKDMADTMTYILADFKNRDQLDLLDYTDIHGNKHTMQDILHSYDKKELGVTSVLSHSLSALQRRIANAGEDMTEEQAAKFLQDSNTITAAIDASGIDPATFMKYLSYFTYDPELHAGSVIKKSAHEAAKTLGNLGVMARNLNTFIGGDPQLQKLLKTYHSDKVQGKIPKVFDHFWRIAQNLDKARIATLTSQISTTARNNITGLGMATAQTGADIIDTAIYHAGIAAGAIKNGNASFRGTLRGMREMWDESAQTFGYLLGQSKSQAVIDATLGTKGIRVHKLLRSVPDFQQGQGSQWLSNYSNFVNTFNIGSDMVFRRAYYARSLNQSFKKYMQQAKDTGKPIMINWKGESVEATSLDQFLESGRRLPTKVLDEAIDDALHRTFAGEIPFKPGLSASTFIRAAQSIPFVTTAAIPFPRFVVHAMRTAWEYSPGDFFSKSARWAFDAELRSAHGADLRQAFAKATVGTGALWAAWSSHQSSDNNKWYEYSDTQVDTRALYPSNVYMAATFLFRWALESYVRGPEEQERIITPYEVLDALEGITSIPFRTGAAGEIANSIRSIVETAGGLHGDSTDFKTVQSKLAQFAGEVLGGYFTPFRMGRDVMTVIDPEEAVYRDTQYALEDLNAYDTIVQTILASNFPTQIGDNVMFMDREDFPSRIYVLDHARKERNAPVAKFGGITFTPHTTVFEREAIKLGITPRDIFPKTKSTAFDRQWMYSLQQVATLELPYIMSTDEYQNATRNEQQGMFLAPIQAARKRVKAAAANITIATYANDVVKYMDQYEQAKKDGASTEELAEIAHQVHLRKAYLYTNPVERAKWRTKSNRQQLAVESRIRKEHEAVKERAAKYGTENFTYVDLLFLKGPTMEDTGLYGWGNAITEGRVP